MNFFTNYRQYIRMELETRVRANARYSLNIFARDLALSPSRLSEVLNGKQGLSREVAARIATSIGLNQREKEYFCDLVEAEHARSAEKRKLAQMRLDRQKLDESYLTLQGDLFHLISDWYHLAIVQLLELPNFRYDHAWMAAAVGISPAEAEGAVERLLRLGVVEKKRGSLKKVQDFVATTDGVPSGAIRKFHSQVLAKAILALSEQSVENRNFSANLLTIDKRQLPKAKEMLKRFRRRFTVKVAGDAKDNNSVYCLSMQLFELTRSPEKA